MAIVIIYGHAIERCIEQKFFELRMLHTINRQRADASSEFGVSNILL